MEKDKERAKDARFLYPETGEALVVAENADAIDLLEEGK